MGECSVREVCAALLDLAKQACGEEAATYLGRALAVLGKFADPATRTVEVTDGQHMILVWQAQESLMSPVKLDFPEGSGMKVGFDDDGNPGAIVWAVRSANVPRSH